MALLLGLFLIRLKLVLDLWCGVNSHCITLSLVFFLQSHGVHEGLGRPYYDFVSLSKELAPPGTLYNARTEIPFQFRNMDKEHESYRGRNVSVR